MTQCIKIVYPKVRGSQESGNKHWQRKDSELSLAEYTNTHTLPLTVCVQLDRIIHTYYFIYICPHTYEGDPKNQRVFIKNCVFILTCLNFSRLQSALHWMQHTYRDVFSHCSKQFLNSILMVFSASAFCLFVCLTSSTSAKHFTLRTFFIQGNKKKSCLG